MANEKQRRGRIRRLAIRVAPGLEALSRYRRSWFPSDLAAERVVIDASPVNIIDVTAVQKIDELREDLAARGIVLAHARAKRNLSRFFKCAWAKKRLDAEMGQAFPTLKSAVRAFRQRPGAERAPMPPSQTPLS